MDIVAATGATAFSDGDLSIDPDQAHTTDDLFRMYRGAQARLATAYEQERVTDNYDADIVALAFSNAEKVGSSDPDTDREQIAFISSEGNEVVSVLDVGCSAGILYDQLRRHCLLTGRPLPHYTGVDFSRSQIERARRKYPHAFFRTGDAADLRFPDNAFDIVVSYSVLSFLPQDRVVPALGELLRVGRKGAITSLICRDDTMPFPGEPEVSLTYWGEDYPITTYAPEFAEVQPVAAASGNIEVIAEDTMQVILPNGREATVDVTDARLPWLRAYLDQIPALLAPEHGGVENVPRDRVVETMKPGGAIKAGPNAEFRMEPRHVWYPYKNVKIAPKGWQWAPDGPLPDAYRTVQVAPNP
ncbi:MAG: class I SAM-dependent methyltransferase [Rhodospirillaceae bacterium]